MTNAYAEAMKVAQQAAREASVRLPLNILQDILAELKAAKEELAELNRPTMGDQPVDSIKSIVTNLKRDA